MSNLLNDIEEIPPSKMQVFRHVGFSATKMDSPYEVECNVITSEEKVT